MAGRFEGATARAVTGSSSTTKNSPSRPPSPPGQIEKANPAVTATAVIPETTPQLAEPKAVVLPKAQADLGA